MIHEVMVLDHGGPDLAFIQYGSAVKLWVLGSLVTGLLVPFAENGPRWANTGMAVAGMLLLAVAAGVVESAMARLKLTRVPQVLAAAAALSALAFVLSVR
jgi:formate hydrogenlyase subunit 4